MSANRLPEFDILMAFYQRDPKAYEEFRKKLLDDAVAAAPVKQHAALKRTLYKIELARQAAGTPLEAAISAHQLMRESIAQLRDSLKRLHHLTSDMQASLLIGKIQQKSKRGA